jgi:hypothetical protein
VGTACAEQSLGVRKCGGFSLNQIYYRKAVIKNKKSEELIQLNTP